MLEFHGLHVIIHVLASATICHHVSGDYKILTPQKPKLFVYGWPDVTSATASMDIIPIEGTIQYDLFYNSTCPFVSFKACSVAITDLSPVDGCHKVENQFPSSLTSKVLSCTICNSTIDCARMRISKDHDLCLYLRVNTSFSFAHSCTELGVRNKLVFPPPKNIQLVPTAKKQLTALWELPDGIKPRRAEIKYKLMLRDQFGNCSIIENKSGDRMFNFTNLNPWSNYSVTICAGLQLMRIKVNTAVCTCGNDHHMPGGPIFNHTLPEEPSTHPSLERCEAFCDDSNFTVIMKWKASKNLIMNGIPKASEIRIFNSSSSSVPTSIFYVHLKPNYNGSLVTHTFSNLTSHSRHIFAKVRFCSSGGCGPDVAQPLGCDVCESLRVPSTSSGTPSHSKNVKWPEIVVGISVAALIVTVIYVFINKKRRPRNRPPLRNVIGDLQPEMYEEPDSPDMTSEDAAYNSLETLLPPNNNQSERWV